MLIKKENKDKGPKLVTGQSTGNAWFTSRYSKKYNTVVMVFNPLRKFWKGNNTNKVSLAS